MSKLRLLITADPEIPVPPKLYGGIERIINSLCVGLTEKGHEVFLLSNPESTCASAHRLNWQARSSSSGSGTILNMSKVVEAYRTIRPDIIHSFSRLAYLAPLLPRKIPKVMSYQREPTPRTVALAARLAKQGSLSFTGCSQYICNRGSGAAGTWKAIHNFVDTEFFTSAPSVSPSGPLVFLSRVESIKGPDVAIEIARRAGRRLIIAGNHAASGPESDFWIAKVKPHLGSDGIEYVGEVNDAAKRSLLGEAAALVVPIRWDEPFGIVFAEALACGTPIISCPRGALPEIVRQGVDGFLVNSVDEGVEAVSQLVKIDRNVCRQRVVENFSKLIIVDRYESLYRSMINHRHPATCG
jgi:glycosyltransferase involved in cell wall biosynthesis